MNKFLCVFNFLALPLPFLLTFFAFGSAPPRAAVSR